MSYQPDTPLAILVRRAQPALLLNAADAGAAACTLTLGIASIGKLMASEEAVGELSASDLSCLGILLADLAATAHELVEMERADAGGGA